MTLLFETRQPRTLAALVERFSAAAAGTRLEAWVFEDAAARRQAETRLRQAGIVATLRSAYKPLVCAFREEIEYAGAARLEIGYPEHPAAVAGRFLLEAYPLAAIVGEERFAAYATGRRDLTYEVGIEDRTGAKRALRIFAPNRVHRDHLGVEQLSPCGWICTTPPDGAGVDEPLETDFETLFGQLMAFARGHAWGGTEPYFEELLIEISLPAADTDLCYAEESISPVEALHEDVYFSLLELFQVRGGREVGDRRLQPGQIAPFVARSDGESLGLRVARVGLNGTTHIASEQPLDDAAAPLGIAQVESELARLQGARFEAHSRAGRPVYGLCKRGSEAAVLISGGQHANETTGVVGALRAARCLASRAAAHFAVVPLENPDGYSLHQRLRRANPRHMHHAARYTALGDDLQYRRAAPLYERAARQEALRLCAPALHVNLHGYPAHEWTRPLTGYVPRGFELWSIPKGFFLILRHWDGYGEVARRLARSVSQELAKQTDLVALNERQLRLYELHAGQLPFEVLNGFPVAIAGDEQTDVPVTLITEFPDETIYQDAFRLGHEAQLASVLAAYAFWQHIGQSARQPRFATP